jgi:uncharacterized OsmC-like protein
MMVNGVDMDTLNATVSAVRTDPDRGRVTFKGITTRHEGAHSTSLFRNSVIAADKSGEICRRNRGPSPVELVLASLGACITVGIAYSADAEGIELSSIELDMEGDVDLRGFLEISRDVRPGFRNIWVTVRVDAGTPREKILEIVNRANSRSPVIDMLIYPLPVRVCLAQDVPAQ